MKRSCEELLQSALEGTTIFDADFSKCDLIGYQFGVKEIRRCNFSENEKMQDTIFSGVKFLENDFTRVSINNGEFSNTRFDHNTFTDSEIIGSFYNSHFRDCDFQRVTFNISSQPLSSVQERPLIFTGNLVLILPVFDAV